MFTPRHVKHSRLLLRHARKYLRYKRDLLDAPANEEVVTGIKDLQQVLQIEQRKFFFFFTFSRLICQQQQFLIYAPPETLAHDFNVFPGRTYHRGEIIARGSVDTGDQVFVDKCSYNFVKPHRGDVFVFRTKHIFGIREDPQAGSPFYIKRLAGLPGDTLRIDPPLLYINGKIEQGLGLAVVRPTKRPYRAYALGRDYLAQPKSSFTVPEHEYFALGDTATTATTAVIGDPYPTKTWSDAACLFTGHSMSTGA